MTDAEPLIDADTLAARLRRGEPVTVLDVRWSLGGADRAAYAEGHPPGAAFLDLDAALCGPPGAGGRHPLPDPATMRTALRAAGVRSGRPVVVYDAGGPNPTGAAARAWWTLRWAGLTDVRVLDGGYPAWLAAGGPITREVPEPAAGDPAGDIEVAPGRMPVWTAEDVSRPGRLLLDARIGPRYRGETEPVDPVAGHIPGAVNAPAAETVGPDGRLLDAAALREHFARLGVRAGREVGAYCGSGVTAAHIVLAPPAAGPPAPAGEAGTAAAGTAAPSALYVGSWSHWITDPDRPVAKGAA